LPYKRASFDAVVCIDGLAHVERPWDFLRECRRILRPKGILIISTPNISSLRSRWRWFLTGFHNKRKTPLNEGQVSPQHIINILSFHTLRYMLHTNGFEISRLRTNRIKAISWLYAPLVPLSYLLTRWVFHREETDPAQRTRNKEILHQMFSRQILFGETLIVKAIRE
jgi:2-polyprenyl-3-methyl-5-hydroxy-6-metoxy-1,4-benzoquinol methylase